MNKLVVKFILIISVSFQISAYAEAPQLPEDWYQNPEDNSADASHSFFPTLPWTKKGKMEKLVKSIYEVNLSSVELTSEKQSSLTENQNKIPNWTPWHLEAFTTELSVVGSGLIGILTGKGTATAMAYWRRHGANVVSSPKSMIDSETDSLPTANIETVYDEKSLKKEIEPIIRSALGTGKIKDEFSFRQNVELAAVDFFNLVNGLRVAPGFKWWVSGARIEFSVSASGKLTAAAPLASVGGDVRVRFDWKRLAQKNGKKVVRFRSARSEAFGFAAHQFSNKLQGNLQDLVTNLAEDLSLSFEDDFEMKGFKPYAFRVGLGFSASGDVGVAKSSASSVISLSFSQDVRDPAKAAVRFVSHSSPLLLIEEKPSESHLQFAANNFIPVTLEANRAHAVYSVDRENFRKGLRKAVKMSNFFISAGKKARSEKWRLYQMKTGLEFSITGSVGLAKYSGVSTAEIAFYNMNF